MHFSQQSSLCIWRRGQVVRQGSAKSSSGVQIPSTPPQKANQIGLLFYFHAKSIYILLHQFNYNAICHGNFIKKAYNKFTQRKYSFYL